MSNFKLFHQAGKIPDTLRVFERDPWRDREKVALHYRQLKTSLGSVFESLFLIYSHALRFVRLYTTLPYRGRWWLADPSYRTKSSFRKHRIFLPEFNSYEDYKEKCMAKTGAYIPIHHGCIIYMKINSVSRKNLAPQAISEPQNHPMWNEESLSVPDGTKIVHYAQNCGGKVTYYRKISWPSGLVKQQAKPKGRVENSKRFSKRAPLHKSQFRNLSYLRHIARWEKTLAERQRKMTSMESCIIIYSER